MPIYEYRCQACGHTLDALQKISEPHLTDCPECDEPKLKRLMSAPSFRLKGGGWYETDFKSDKEARRNLAGETETKKADEPAAKGNGKSSSDGSGKSAGDGAAKPAGDGKSASGAGKSDAGSSSASKPKPSGTEAA